MGIHQLPIDRRCPLVLAFIYSVIPSPGTQVGCRIPVILGCYVPFCRLRKIDSLRCGSTCVFIDDPIFPWLSGTNAFGKVPRRLMPSNKNIASFVVDNSHPCFLGWPKLAISCTKANSYIAQYLILRTVQSALHFTSLTDLFTQTPSRFLWEASSHMPQLMREGCSYTYPPLSIVRYSFIQLSELEHLPKVLTPQHRIRTRVLVVESPKLYR